jgi:hypothetical protein
VAVEATLATEAFAAFAHDALGGGVHVSTVLFLGDARRSSTLRSRA